MGGKNPTIVLADADISKAVNIAVGGFRLTGQACTATNNVIVEELPPIRCRRTGYCGA